MYGYHFGRRYSYIYLKDKLILKKNEEILVYNSNNFELSFKFKENSNFKIYPFNERYFTVCYKDGSKAIIKLYY